MSDDHRTPELPPWFTPVRPTTDTQQSLFKISLESALARAQVSSDELNRWHSKRWICFASVPMELNDDPGDPRLKELDFVRDVVRSGLTDAQITHLFDHCPRPHSFDPARAAFSFRYGMVEAVPPTESEEPADVIEGHLDSWLEECDAERLASLRDQIEELLKRPAEPQADTNS